MSSFSVFGPQAKDSNGSNLPLWKRECNASGYSNLNDKTQLNRVHNKIIIGLHPDKKKNKPLASEVFVDVRKDMKPKTLNSRCETLSKTERDAIDLSLRLEAQDLNMDVGSNNHDAQRVDEIRKAARKAAEAEMREKKAARDADRAARTNAQKDNGSKRMKLSNTDATVTQTIVTTMNMEPTSLFKRSAIETNLKEIKPWFRSNWPTTIDDLNSRKACGAAIDRYFETIISRVLELHDGEVDPDDKITAGDIMDIAIYPKLVRDVLQDDELIAYAENEAQKYGNDESEEHYRTIRDFAREWVIGGTFNPGIKVQKTDGKWYEV